MEDSIANHCYKRDIISNQCTGYSSQLNERDAFQRISFIQNERRGAEALEERLADLGLVHLVKRYSKREPYPDEIKRSTIKRKAFPGKKRYQKKTYTPSEVPTSTTSSDTAPTNSTTAQTSSSETSTTPDTSKVPKPTGPSSPHVTSAPTSLKTNDTTPETSKPSGPSVTSVPSEIPTAPTTSKGPKPSGPSSPSEIPTASTSSKKNATSTSSAPTSTATYPSVKEILDNYTDYSKPLTFSYSSTEQYNSYLDELGDLFVNPTQAVLEKSGWPPLEIYDPKNDTMFWWRNDPVSNQHHELWHIVESSSVVDEVRQDREGENFVYMHRHMLARYDADRLGVGLEIVDPLPDYRTPILQPFYPDPYLSQDNDSDPSTPRVWFVARPANESMKDIVQIMGGSFFVFTIKFMEHTYDELVKWINHEYTADHPVQLGWNDSEADTLGSKIELVLHNLGHSVLGFIMHPYSIGYPPSVLVGARGGLRDPLFWRWHRHLDNLFYKFQKKLGPYNFSEECPNVTIHANDIYLSFTDVLIDVAPDGKEDGWQAFGEKTFGGANFSIDLSNSSYVTSELQTKMRNRTYTWLEDNYDKENISQVYPRDWHYFFRVENNIGLTSIITIRTFIVPEVLANSSVHWIELDKFKRSLKPYEKAVLARACDKAIVIRKPAQKNNTEMDSTAITAKYRDWITNNLNDKQASELLFCNCGWPYNMILPRGNRTGMKFKMIVFISDGLNDLVPTFDQCGSTLLCGGQKWTDKIPDAKPLGFPFNRPLKDDSYEKTFAGLTNVAIRDFTIKLVDDFPEV